eukprot:TRINITY_DN37165_c0_g1_i1.p1 TRINITY_DN37165_c0_g1~~TRINITY_DN37165_c0_g1_i1.p1  ORF type:complete len:245 (+),score=41.51 TRINITY_DN37165_c0_g1_i1:61-795(+)
MTARELDSKGLFVGQISEEVLKGALSFAEKAEKEAHKWDESDSAGKRPSRSTLNYGWDFVQLEKGEKKWNEVPDELKKVQEAVFEVFSESSSDAKNGFLKQASDLDNIIVTFYGEGESIVPHFDRAEDPNKSFHFGDSVFGVVLQPDTSSDPKESPPGGIFWMKSTESKGSLTMDKIKPEIQPPEVPGMTFMMQSTIRNWPYYHGVIPVKTKRISVTLRVTRFKQKSKHPDDSPPEGTKRPKPE